MATLSFLLRATSSRLLSISCCVFFSFLSSVCVCLLFSCCRLYWRWLYGPFFFIGVSKRGRFFSIGRTPQKRRPFATFHCSHTTTYFLSLSLSLSISFRSLSLFIQSMCVYCLPWRDPFQFPRARSRAYTREQQQQQQIKNKKKNKKTKNQQRAPCLSNLFTAPPSVWSVHVL